LGTITYLLGKRPHATREHLEDAAETLSRAVSVLRRTYGPEALWTLAAKYRLGVCLYDLAEYEQAVSYLRSVVRAFRGYDFEIWHGHEGADIMWQKGRALWKCGRALLMTGREEAALEAVGFIWESSGIYFDVDVNGDDERAPEMDDAMWDRKILPLYR
jgi:tetratricopeptide (TPR) repeat protein